MSQACESFRAEVEDALAGRVEGLDPLRGHGHLRSCLACRIELARERGLERLLDAVPTPEAPPFLAQGVLSALAGERRGARTPSTREEPDLLDEFLDHLPSPRVPEGLAERVLAGVAGTRAPARARRPRRLLAAAAGLAALTAWGWTAFRGSDPESEVAFVDGAGLEADADLMAYAVENWELLHDEDLDVWLASLDPLDEILMEVVGGEAWQEEGAAHPEGGN